MIFPIGTDRKLRHRPWVNITLIAINVLVFLWDLQTTGTAGVHFTEPLSLFMLWPQQPEVYQFFTSQFLHGGWSHLIFNMLFLYVFGNSLEDRLGPIGYLGFYLSGGVVAGLGQVWITPLFIGPDVSPMLGASGAIAAVTGGYLALFPLSRITIIWWFFVITTFEVSSLFFIAFYFFRDVFFQLIGASTNVAYLAHISGNLFGFAVGMFLLLGRVLPREPFDFLALLGRYKRRRDFRSATRSGDSPWMADAAPSKRVSRREAETPEAVDENVEMHLRHQIDMALQGYLPDQAMGTYRQLLKIKPDAVLPQQQQLDLANYAMRQQSYDLAAQAYEAYLKTYGRDSSAHEVRLMLGVIYARYLDRPERARQLLIKAAEHAQQEEQRNLASNLLNQLPPQS